MNPLRTVGAAATTPTQQDEAPGRGSTALDRGHGSHDLFLAAARLGGGPLVERARAAGIEPAQLPEVFLRASALMELGQTGRVFVDTATGLKRATAAEAKALLDQGRPIQIVTVHAETTHDSRYSSDSRAWQVHFFSPGQSSERSSRTRTESRTYHYSVSPVGSWEDLLFVEPGQGVLGVPILPLSGSVMEVDLAYESSWRASEFNSWGIFRPGQASSQSGGEIVMARAVLG